MTERNAWAVIVSDFGYGEEFEATVYGGWLRRDFAEKLFAACSERFPDKHIALVQCEETAPWLRNTRKRKPRFADNVIEMPRGTKPN